MEANRQPPLGGDVNRGPINLAVTAVFISLCTVTVLLRVYTRTRVAGTPGLDDFTALAAWAIGFIGLACHIIEVRHGMGRHEYYLSISDITAIGKWELGSQIQNVLAVTLAKLSATLLILRLIAGATSRSLRWALFGLMVLLITIAMITILADVLQCIPVAASWDPRVKGKCLRPDQVLAFGYTMGAFTILTDVVCAAFPVIILQRLQMNRRKKIALSFVMSMGLLTAACAAVKLSYLGGIKAHDISWGYLNVDMWAMIEQNVGVIACSIPALYPLIKSSLRSKPSQNQARGSQGSTSFIPSWIRGSAKFFGSSSRESRGGEGSVSEERILPPGQDVIRKTTNIQLEIRGQSSSNEEGER